MPITQDFLDSTSSVSFTAASDIDDYFNQHYSSAFIAWFNANVGGRNNWGTVPGHAPLSIATDAQAQDRFNQLWSSDVIQIVFGGTSLSLLQFLALQSVILNETGGQNQPLLEKVEIAGHPGIAYAFDAIQGLKYSYNTLTGNRTAFDSFNDTNYNTAFGSKPLGDQLSNTTDAAWKGTTYPQGAVSTSTDPNVTGYVLEADFYKFRGRGLIQTTSRTNYKALVDYVLAYSGTNAVVQNTKSGWSAQASDSDTVATISANSEWDDLFLKTANTFAATAISLHNQGAGNYLGGIDGSNPANASSTIRNVGMKVGGATGYANLFLSRVTQWIEAM